MSESLLMPKLGLTMTEGGLAQWLVEPGKPFKKGDPLFIVETEKVANEIEADQDGVLEHILVPQGETVAVGTVLARWSCTGAPATATPLTRKPRIKLRPVVRDVVSLVQTAPAYRAPDGRIIATPYARRLAREANLDLAEVSTARLRITAEDVRRALIKGS